jgi:hypothetical protein
LPDPVHIARIIVNHVPVWYDCSDFPASHPSLGTPYFSKNALAADCPPVIPIGQYLGSEPQRMLDSLKRLRSLPKRHKAVAVFSNIDERLSAPANDLHEAAERNRKPVSLRRQVVEKLRDEPGIIAGLWRWSILRPDVSDELASAQIPLDQHWERVARSWISVCLPGVGGDSTRARTEAAAIGTAIVTVKGDQEWPGNWRGCWVEADRGPAICAAVVRGLSADKDECKRVGRLGKWYFETNLRPERMAERVVRECV